MLATRLSSNQCKGFLTVPKADQILRRAHGDARQHHLRLRPHLWRAGTVSVRASSSTTSVRSDWVQKSVNLPPFKRGCHVITRNILAEIPEISEFDVGLVNFFIMHTSASLTVNENASPDVPLDLNDTLDRIVPEGNIYRHLDEGYDDMPAHVKSSLMGPSLTVPINKGRLALGIWQGIYLNEHRNNGGSRTVVVTVQGRRKE